MRRATRHQRMPGRRAPRRLAAAAAYLAWGLMAPTASMASDCATSDVASPARPQTKNERRLFRVLSAVPDPAAKVLILGDSIAAQWPQDQSDAAFGRKTFNFGHPGDQIANLLWRLGVSRIAFDKFEQAVLIVGTNNLGRHDACQIVEGILSVVRTLKERAPSIRVAVVSILPRGQQMRVARHKIADVNAQLEKSAEAAGYDYIDAHSVFRRQCEGSETCGLYRGPLHLARPGYQRLGELLKPVIGTP